MTAIRHGRGLFSQLTHSCRIDDSLPLLALLLWGIGVASTNLARAQGVNGLIPALPWTFWAGVGLLLFYVAIQLHRSVISRIRLGVSAATFVFMVQSLVPLIYQTPRYVWDFKTVGEIQYDNLHGALNSNLDIYQHWPGFFSLVAWFDHIAGIASPLSYLTWVTLFFDLLAVATFGFAISSLPMTEREKWFAVFLFCAGEWYLGFAQDILVPQALGLSLYFITIGLVLRFYWVLPTPTELGRNRRRLAQFRLTRPLWRDDESPLPVNEGPQKPLWRLGDWRLLALLLAVFVPLVISHPLTPYVVVLELGALTLVNRVRPLWLPVILGAVTLAYLIPNLGFLTSRHEFLAGLGGIAANAAPTPTSPAGPLGPNHIVIPVMVILLYGLAAVGAFIRYRAHRDVRTFAALAVTPLFIVALVHYGTETLYRSILFSTPWTACIAASVIGPARLKEAAHRRKALIRRSVGIRVGATFAVMAILAALLLVVENSQNELYQVSPGDIGAAQWLNKQPPGVAIYLNGEFPARIGGRYDKFLAKNLDDVYLGDEGYHVAPIQHINAFACGQTWGVEKTSYIVLSDNEASFAIREGYARAGFLRRLRAELSNSASWQLTFKNDTTTIYRGPSGCH